MKTNATVSKQTLRRLPVYLHYLNFIKNDAANISATGIAEFFDINDVQVRKDLAVVSGSGRPKTGYVVAELIAQIEEFLGSRTETDAILVGAGNLGRALMSYNGFAEYGISISAAFDKSDGVCGTTVNGKPVLPYDGIEEYCAHNDIQMGIITVPVGEAQSVCDRLTGCGVRAVWNFAPTILRVAPGVLVENENLASSLAILSRHLREGESGGEKN